MITLTKPLIQPSMSKINLLSVNLDLPSATVLFTYEQTDTLGIISQGRTTMTGAAFVAAFTNTSGDFKAILYTVFQGSSTSFAGIIT